MTGKVAGVVWQQAMLQLGRFPQNLESVEAPAQTVLLGLRWNSAAHSIERRGNGLGNLPHVSFKQKKCLVSHCQGSQQRRRISAVVVPTERAKLATARCFQTLVWLSSTHPFCVPSTSLPPHIYRNLKSMESRVYVYNYLKLCIAFPCSLLLQPSFSHRNWHSAKSALLSEKCSSYVLPDQIWRGSIQLT